MSLLGQVAELLQRQQVPFAVIGASALAVHGVSRSTFDIDLLVTDRRTLSPQFWTLDAKVDIRRGDEHDPLAGVIRLRAAGERDIDVVVGRAAWQAELLESNLRVELEGTQVPVVAAAGVILLKLYAGGLQDQWDIQQLLAAGTRAALIAAVDGQAGALPADARELWQRLRA